MGAAFQCITENQVKWANDAGITNKRGYASCVEDNLLYSLPPDIKGAFASGKGDELDWKMKALHSSSALACNVFTYWVLKEEIDAIGQACGASPGMTKLVFERHHRTPIPRATTPPHLDLEFTSPGLKPLAIESKFSEPYSPHQDEDNGKPFHEAYFRNGVEYWTGLEMPECQRLAKNIQEGRIEFKRLAAPQLLRHILGLANSYGRDGFGLLYLWYDLPSPEGSEHRREIQEIWNKVSVEIDFRSMTYQELFNRIASVPGVDKAYTSYLTERYFP